MRVVEPPPRSGSKHRRPDETESRTRFAIGTRTGRVYWLGSHLARHFEKKTSLLAPPLCDATGVGLSVISHFGRLTVCL